MYKNLDLKIKNARTINFSEYKQTKLSFGTKAETLQKLSSTSLNCKFASQLFFSVNEWNANPDLLIGRIQSQFINTCLIIRSSANDEDGINCSNAGVYTSVKNIYSHNTTQLSHAINEVIASYQSDENLGSNQVLIQHQIKNVLLAGVVLTCGLDSGAPYYYFNYDDSSGLTDSVTSGTNNKLRTIILPRANPNTLSSLDSRLVDILNVVVELEQLFCINKLDIEFAINSLGDVYVFQVRPITVKHPHNKFIHTSMVQETNLCQQKYIQLQNKSLQRFGQKTIFANMPDWNPAEIIGNRPMPLAYSLYKELITNEVWAQQRAEYGYKDVRPFKLMKSFAGQPYIDVLASISSFIPNDLSTELTTKLTTAYLDIFKLNRQLHDKLEFKVLYTIWTPDFRKLAKKRFFNYSIATEEIHQLEKSLKLITLGALTRLESDTKSIKKLKELRVNVMASNISLDNKIQLLINNCKQYGTLAFAHASRAGFVAASILDYFIRSNTLSLSRKELFMKSIHNICSEFQNDLTLNSQKQLSTNFLCQKYGHLRPGTYEINRKAYWEKIEEYFSTSKENVTNTFKPFELSKTECLGVERYLSELGSNKTATQLFEFLTNAIKSRESIKFEFSKNLSLALDLFVKLGKLNNISRKDLSYIQFDDIKHFANNKLIKNLNSKIQNQKLRYLNTLQIKLPSIILSEKDFFGFELLSCQANFISSNRVVADVLHLNSSNTDDVCGKIILISQADPGYDWLFTKGIVGLITQYGGVNSHMAIRSAELNLPAAIGVGEKTYNAIKLTSKAEIDCKNHTIRKIK